jgi:hypothetical protein
MCECTRCYPFGLRVATPSTARTHKRRHGAHPDARRASNKILTAVDNARRRDDNAPAAQIVDQENGHGLAPPAAAGDDVDPAGGGLLDDLSAEEVTVSLSKRYGFILFRYEKGSKSYVINMFTGCSRSGTRTGRRLAARGAGARGGGERRRLDL